jgi:hypothetical protein
MQLTHGGAFALLALSLAFSVQSKGGQEPETAVSRSSTPVRQRSRLQGKHSSPAPATSTAVYTRYVMDCGDTKSTAISKNCEMEQLTDEFERLTYKRPE